MSYIKITESEWKIMRVLWEYSPISSKDIIGIFHGINDWSPTTIKTFISRLVGNNVISFHQENNKQMYFPLITEKECVENEMIATIHKVYGGTETLALDHFVFYGNDDESYIHLLSENIEEQYERVATNLNFRFTEKQSIYLYSSLKRLHSALGYHNGPKWIKAGCPWGVLHIAPHDSFVGEDPRQILMHIIVQKMLYKINPDIPAWLSQGIAAYESKWLDTNRIKKVLNSQHEFINLSNLEYKDNDIQLFQQNGGYELSFLFVEYIIDKYGYILIQKFISNPSLCNNQIIQEWNSHLQLLNEGD